MYYNDNSNIQFTKAQYENLKEVYRKWWDNKLDRPILGICLYGTQSKREPSPHPLITFSTAWDFNITPQQFVDAYDWNLSATRYYGEAYPRMNPVHFGAGTAATFLGCTPISRPDTVWFLPDKNVPIEQLHFEFDPNNKYLRRVLNIYEAAMDKWQGEVVISMIDIGGVMDLLASFRNAEDLLIDMIDSPDEVLRCVNELQELWIKYFDMINDIIKDSVNGYSSWFGMYSEEPSYILQSDFCYMISPEMFDVFVGPELKKTASHLYNATYHLDGIGELPHLESILKIDEIKGIQWVCGSGEPELMDWSEVTTRILKANKKVLNWTLKPDGTLRDCITDPCMAFLGDYYFADTKEGIENAKRFAFKHNLELNI
ncbi:MAG: hypothetical protein FWF15_05370 [Oscillospiraceae bacterium]|nr:hypothetical protein [Oscillospiraceae bacterium]